MNFARKPWRTEGPFVTDDYPRLIACLDENRERHGLEWGVADDWDARLVSLFSRTGLWGNQVLPEGHTHPWIMNVDWYLARRGERSDSTFIITRRPSSGSSARRARLSCDGAEVLVYGEGLDSALREAFAHEMKRPADR